MKEKERKRAIKLRKLGLSYNEILERVSVSKSTLSVWLRDVGLAKSQKQRLTKKRKLAQLKAQRVCRERRIEITKEIREKASKEIGEISQRNLWLVGISLYWAEGNKQKESNVSERVGLGNSDPDIIRIFILWLTKICKIKRSDIDVRLAIHETANEKRAKKYWSKISKVPIPEFKKTLIKRHNPKTNRKYNKNYNGLLIVSVKKSTNFNRKIKGWIDGIIDNTGV